jgi:anti-sigma28 factor (negative regulator of flagellin synthesis)
MASSPSPGRKKSVEIRGIHSAAGSKQVTPVSGSQASEATRASQPQPIGGDNVQISPIAHYLDMYNNMPQVRNDKVASARQAVSAGTMDTDQKLSIAVDRMLDDLLSK